jgi:hypothetical protein
LGSVTILLLKLTLSPLMIALASLAARRFGPAAGGWLIGLPVTAGPVVLVLALDHGAAFATHVATGFVAGVSAEVAFDFGYVALASRGAGWLTALLAGSTCFAVAGTLLEGAGLPLSMLLAVALTALLVAIRFVPAGDAAARPVSGRRALALRMVAATTMVLAVTSLASTLGPGESGVLTTFPLLTSILAVSIHRSDPRAAIAVFRGLLFGIFALTGFAATLALVVSREPLGVAFSLAVILTLSIQLGSLPTLKRTAGLRT